MGLEKVSACAAALVVASGASGRPPEATRSALISGGLILIRDFEPATDRSSSSSTRINRFENSLFFMSTPVGEDTIWDRITPVFTQT